MKSRGFCQQSEPRKYILFSNSAASHTHEVIYGSIVCNWQAFRDRALGGRRKDWGRENGAPRAAPGVAHREQALRGNQGPENVVVREREGASTTAACLSNRPLREANWRAARMVADSCGGGRPLSECSWLGAMFLFSVLETGTWGGPPWDSGSDPEPSRVANADSAHSRGAGGTGLVQVALENSVLIKARDKKMRFVPWLLCMFFTWTVVLRL